MKQLNQLFPSEVIVSTSTSGDLSSIHGSPDATHKSIYPSTIKTRNTTSINSSPAQSISASSSSAACEAALSFVSGVGDAVQHVCVSINTLNVCNNNDTSHDPGPLLPDKGSNLTTDSLGEEGQILDDLYKLNQIISWNTHGSMSTTQSICTNNTNTNSVPFSRMDDPGNKIVTEVMKPHQGRSNKNIDNPPYCGKTTKSIHVDAGGKPLENKRENKSRKKVVKFEYPHITSVKECPRIKNEDKSALFFTEHELDQYYNDRRIFLHGTVEVMAVHESDTDIKEKEAMVSHECRAQYDGAQRNNLHDTKDDKGIIISDSKSREIGFGGKAILPPLNWNDDEYDSRSMDVVGISKKAILPTSDESKLRSRTIVTSFDESNDNAECTTIYNYNAGSREIRIEKRAISPILKQGIEIGIHAKVNTHTEGNLISKNSVKQALRKWAKRFSVKNPKSPSNDKKKRNKEKAAIKNSNPTTDVMNCVYRKSTFGLYGKQTIGTTSNHINNIGGSNYNKNATQLDEKQQQQSDSILVKELSKLLSSRYSKSVDEEKFELQSSSSTLNSEDTMEEVEAVTLKFLLHNKLKRDS